MKNKITRGSHTLEAFEQGFQRLDELLGQNGLTLRIIVCGGYLMQQMGIRGTVDVDAFYVKNDEVEALIKQVGVELGLNTEYSTWLNRSVATMSDWPGEKFYERLHTFNYLTVDKITTEYLLGMKLRSTRNRDVTDSVILIKHINILDPIELYHHLNNMAINVGMSYILTAFSEMHGNHWFGQYFTENQKELLEILRIDDLKGKESM